MDSVGSDDEVVGPTRTIIESDEDLISVLSQRGHGCAKPHRDAVGAIEQDAVKVNTGNAHAAADAVP
ncbi:MAG TPA: hypothetical protein VHI98_28795 [Vicinamibacterales bacterium]|jgi:hypothetical protein|nr:hypothetical protein [Vicinamibacterales bacterium]